MIAVESYDAAKGLFRPRTGFGGLYVNLLRCPGGMCLCLAVLCLSATGHVLAQEPDRGVHGLTVRPQCSPGPICVGGQLSCTFEAINNVDLCGDSIVIEAAWFVIESPSGATIRVPADEGGEPADHLSLGRDQRACWRW